MLDGLREDARRWGWTRSIYVRVMERVQPVLHVSAVMVRPLSGSLELPDLPGQFSVRIASRDDLDRAMHDPRMDLDPGFVERALARGDFCSAVFDCERMVAYSWNAFGPTPHGEDLCVDFDPPAGYSYKAFTHPDYRGRRLQNAVAWRARSRYLERGRTMVLSFVDTHNLASLASSRHRPNEVVGFAGYLDLRSAILPFRSPGAKRYGFRFFPCSRQALDAPEGPHG